MSLLLGIALEDDFLSSLNRPIVDYLHESEYVQPLINAITLENTLTMSAGFLWNEMDVPYTSLFNDDLVLQHSKDPLKYYSIKADNKYARYPLVL